MREWKLACDATHQPSSDAEHPDDLQHTKNVASVFDFRFPHARGVVGVADVLAGERENNTL
jgi:hypothetical protein